MQHTPDPVTVAVVQNRLTAIVEEMGEAMLRTAYSQILNSSRDFSIALTDVRARLVAQADHIPVHVGAMPWAARAVIEAFGADVAAGDVFLLNDPYHGGSHLPDVTVFVPVLAEGVLRFWSVVRAHQSDIGGATHGAYNPGATEIWQEGIRLPPIRIGERGELRADLLAMLAANVRHPRDFAGDLAAMIGAARLGERRLAALISAHGAATLDDIVTAMLDASERHARAVVATWRDGTYAGEAILDDDGHGAADIAIRARVTIAGSDVTVDLSGSDDQVRGFVNSSFANSWSAAAMAFAYLLDPDTAKNEGAFRPLKVILREGSIVNALPPAPVTLCTSHPSNEIVEAIIAGLAPACPDRAMAGWGRRFRIAIAGHDAARGRGFIWHLFHARPGGGASPAGDGWDTAGEWHSVGGIKFGSIEIAEQRFPLHFESHELAPGTEGAGQHRGGRGATLRLLLRADAVGNTAGDGTRHGARGMLGGEDGTPHRYVLHTPGVPSRELRTKETGIAMPAGSVLDIRSGGGGGWGDPAARPAGLEQET